TVMRKTRTLLLSIALLAAGMGTGCGPEGQACSSGCPAGERCDRGRCVPRGEPRWEGPAPARHLDATHVDGTTYIAAVAPSERAVLAGRLRADGPRFRRLTVVERPTATALAGSPPTVAWLEGSTRYQIARRRAGHWGGPETADPSATAYAGSRDFDLGLSTDGDVHLVFRDARSGALRHLHGRPDGTWSIDTIDDGDRKRPSRTCDAPKGSRPAGREPDLALLDGRVFVSYFDPICGDLRLGRRTAEGWAVSVLDTGARGDIERETAANTVGRFSSLAVDTEGRLGVAYYDQGRGRLYLADEEQGQFRIQLVDPGIAVDRQSQTRNQYVGAHASLTYDAQGMPRIGYQNATDVRVQFAVRSGAGEGDQWLHRVLPPSAPSGFYTRVVAPPQRDPIVLTERKPTRSDGLSSRLVVEEISP
ncbi:MAG: hypothetical protein ABEL76_15170, partial [Bradymonadaceae bacterium]